MLTLATVNFSVQRKLENDERLLLIANSLLLLSLLVMLVSITMSFIFPYYFSISVQVVAHMSTIIFAGVLKVAYVLRCVARKGLGQEV